MANFKLIFLFFTCSSVFGQWQGGKPPYQLDSIPFYRLNANTTITSPIIRFTSDSLLIMIYTEKECLSSNKPKVETITAESDLLRIMYSKDSMLFNTFIIDTLERMGSSNCTYVVQLDSVFLSNADNDSRTEIWLWYSKGLAWSSFYEKNDYVYSCELFCLDDIFQLISFATEVRGDRYKMNRHFRNLTREFGSKFKEQQKQGRAKLVYAKTKNLLDEPEK